MLKNMHRGTVHTGKVPAKLAGARQRNQELAKLREELDRAVVAEQFEEAAGLRDRIRRLENEAREAEPAPNRIAELTAGDAEPLVPKPRQKP
jgi:protein arginine kinase activator